jgi:probable F420-dependent oxidoreductase
MCETHRSGARRAGKIADMDIGIQLPHIGKRASPSFVRDWCTVADEAGFDVLWTADHVVTPQRTESLYTLAPQPARIEDDAVSRLMAPNYEMLTTLAFVAGFTSKIKLATGVAILPIRNAVLNARQVATIDVYSGGRVLYGVGAGWLKEEADAMNMPWDRRGARVDEHIRLLRCLWTADSEHVSFEGEFFHLPPMGPEPLPVQRPIPILVGGHSDRAIDRAVRLGDGWMASTMSINRLSDHLDTVRSAAERHGRDPATVLVYVHGAELNGRDPDAVAFAGRNTQSMAGAAKDESELLRQLDGYRMLGVTGVTVSAESIADLEHLAKTVLPIVKG